MIFIDNRSQDRDRMRRVAEQLGYFWAPCPLCSEPFAGFEWLSGSGIPVVDADGHVSGQAVCAKPGCQYEAFVRGFRAPSPFTVVDDAPVTNVVPLSL